MSGKQRQKKIPISFDSDSSDSEEESEMDSSSTSAPESVVGSETASSASSDDSNLSESSLSDSKSDLKTEGSSETDESPPTRKQKQAKRNARNEPTTTSSRTQSSKTKKTRKNDKKASGNTATEVIASDEAAPSRYTSSPTTSPKRQKRKHRGEEEHKDASEMTPQDTSTTVTDSSPNKSGDKTQKKKDDLKAEIDIDEHALSISELMERYSIQIGDDPLAGPGLSSSEAQARLQQHGPNILTPPKQLPEIVKFLKQFTNFFMILLNIAGILSCVAWALDRSQNINLYLGIILFIVVFVTCVSGYFQERNTSNVMNVFGKMMARQCKVIREGHEQAIDVKYLVPGDLVRVQGGTVVPADLRIIKVSGLKVEASSLTGETDPIQCTVEKTHDIARESANIAFNSAQCLEGEAIGIVIRTGDNTVIGRIAALAGGTEAVETTFQKEVKRVVYIIAGVAFSTAVVFFAIGMLRGQPFVSTFVNGFILVLVANIPQGLPATVSSLLTLTANRMRKKNVLVKRLECVETLGSCTVIASDKTGTLTENKMHVEHVWFDYHSHTAGRITDRPTQAFKSAAFNSLYRVAALCNRAHFEEDPDAVVEMPVERTNRARKSMEIRRSQDDKDPESGPGPARGRRSVEWTRDTSRLKIVGDASETALFRFCNQVQPMEAYQEANPKIFEIPFNSTNKWQLSIHKVEVRIGDKLKERRLLVMKGAPEIILAKCTHVLSKGQRTPLDDTFKEEFESAYKRFGSYGERVLAFAELELDPKIYKPSMDKQYDVRKNNFPTSGLTFVGLISLMDPPRKGVKEAIVSCHAAGIRVVMVTGDHPFTAEAIAKKVGIIGEYLTAHDIAERDGIDVADVPDEEVDAVVVHGHTLVNYKQEDWDRILSKHEIVFARTSPQQKLQIVENLQRLNEIVAVTGDGVNDSPALRRADIGVAMGICGSDVAKEAADIILTDDNFASIVSGIREGRIIFDNLKKTIAYTLTHLLPELIPVLLNLAGSLPLALGSLFILVIDLGTELAPAISLAYERPESDIMSRPPRDAKKDRLVTWQLLVYSYFIAGSAETLCCLLSYFMVYYWNDIPASSLPGSQGRFFLKPTNSSEYFYNSYGRIYSPEEQYRLSSEAQTSYFITLVMCQFSHIWMCKTRTRSLLQHGLGNMVMNFGVIIEIALCVIVAYVPFLNPIFESVGPAGQYWLPWLAGLAFLWAYNEGRKLCFRTWPNGIVAKYFMW